jgi:hypothetical protein
MESNHTMLLKEMTKMQRMLSRSLSAAGALPNQQPQRQNSQAQSQAGGDRLNSSLNNSFMATETKNNETPTGRSSTSNQAPGFMPTPTPASGTSAGGPSHQPSFTRGNSYNNLDDTNAGSVAQTPLEPVGIERASSGNGNQ